MSETGTEKQQTWMDFVDEVTSGDYLKFPNSDVMIEKEIKVVMGPIVKVISIPQDDGSVKNDQGLEMDVLVDNSSKIIKWSTNSRQVLQQIRAIAKKEGLDKGTGNDLSGCKFQVNAIGHNMQKKYFIKLISKPKGA